MIIYLKKFLGFLSIFCFALLIFIPTGKVIAVSPQIDDFSNEDLAGWVTNFFGNVFEIRTPGGVGNSAYLFSGDEGSHLGAINENSGHTGDYSQYEDIGISFFFKGFTDNVGDIAFGLHQDGSSALWFIMLDDNPPVGSWVEYSFVIDPSWTDAEAIAHGWEKSFSPSTFSIYLTDIDGIEIQILGYGGPDIPFEIGLDNITISVPFSEFSQQIYLSIPVIGLIIFLTRKKFIHN
jgi:hypothetical protein